MNHNIKAGISYRDTKFDFLKIRKKGNGRTVPITNKSQLAAYLKDAIAFNNGLVIAPGIRVENQKLEAEKDKYYIQNSAFEAANGYIPEGETTTITPSFNVSFKANENLTFFGSYARGNKQPDTANLGTFDHGFGWIIPNKNLKNETSNNFELGFNYIKPNTLELKLTAFVSDYDNFIEYKVDGTYGQTDKGKPKMILRPYNLNEVKTYGAEAELGYYINNNIHLNSSLAWMNGKFGSAASHGVTLSQGYPTKLLLGATYDNGLWGARLGGELVADSKHLNQEDYKKFEAPGYGKWDLTGWWTINKNFSVNAGIYNLFDKKYWLNNDVNGLPLMRMNKPVNFDVYTQPGRNFAIGFKAEL